MRPFCARIANLFGRALAEREMAREIASHLALVAENFERTGMPPQAAALAARRVFTLVAVFALALGLRVNFTIFAVYDALLLKPLPVGNPGRTVRLQRWFQHHQGNDQFRFAPLAMAAVAIRALCVDPMGALRHE